MLVKLVSLPLVVFAGGASFGCADEPVSAPSPVPSAAVSSPAPSPGQDFSALVGVWHVMVRVTEVTGTGCVADTMRSQSGVVKPYSLSIAQMGSTLKATLTSASGDRACTFTPVPDGSGFTTFGKGGRYSCADWYVPFRCQDETSHSIFTIGENISGHVTGNQITGAWHASWYDGWDDYAGVEMKAEFTGSR